jgi:hypothetical protein
LNTATETKEEQKPWCSWDTAEIVEAQHDFLWESTELDQLKNLPLSLDEHTELQALVAKFNETGKRGDEFSAWLKAEDPAWFKWLDDRYWKDAAEDSDVFTFRFEDLCNDVEMLMEKVRKETGSENSEKWLVEGSNMGWRHRSGWKIVEAETSEAGAKKLIRDVLPDTDCTYSVLRQRHNHRAK